MSVVRVAPPPPPPLNNTDRWKTEKDFGQSAATVSFICLKLLSLYIGFLCSGFSSLAVSFFFYLLFWFGRFWLRACRAKSFLIIRLAFCGFTSFAVFASECLRFYLKKKILYCISFSFFFFPFAKLASLPSRSFCQSLLFHTLMFLSPPAFHYVTPPVSAMHLGNQETESDAEDEVKPHPPHPCAVHCARSVATPLCSS